LQLLLSNDLCGASLLETATCSPLFPLPVDECCCPHLFAFLVPHSVVVVVVVAVVAAAAVVVAVAVAVAAAAAAAAAFSWAICLLFEAVVPESFFRWMVDETTLVLFSWSCYSQIVFVAVPDSVVQWTLQELPNVPARPQRFVG
jgi:hypothetical protein